MSGNECGCLVTAETKKKLIKGSGEIREYVYYHCTRRKTEMNCSQRQVIREDELERQIAEEIQQCAQSGIFKVRTGASARK